MLLFHYKLIISTRIFKILIFLPSYNPFKVIKNALKYVFKIINCMQNNKYLLLVQIDNLQHVQVHTQ